jgi:hypothetical protein
VKPAAAAATLAAALSWFGASSASEDASVDPHVGTWRCVLFGNPALGDERVLLKLEADGRTGIARAADTDFRPWMPASSWRVSDGKLSFSDPRTGRHFEADLGRSTLGGTWQSRTLVGGWWCAPASAEEHAALIDAAIPGSSTDAYLPPLFPLVMATPTYPREAIRAAKEGRAVVCFVVDAEGLVSEPEFLELSDEIFRAPSLDSLARSRYRGWEDKSLVRPGCRTFIYRLDAIY